MRPGYDRRGISKGSTAASIRDPMLAGARSRRVRGDAKLRIGSGDDAAPACRIERTQPLARSRGTTPWLHRCRAASGREFSSAERSRARVPEIRPLVVPSAADCWRLAVQTAVTVYWRFGAVVGRNALSRGFGNGRRPPGERRKSIVGVRRLTPGQPRDRTETAIETSLQGGPKSRSVIKPELLKPAFRPFGFLLAIEFGQRHGRAELRSATRGDDSARPDAAIDSISGRPVAPVPRGVLPGIARSLPRAGPAAGPVCRASARGEWDRRTPPSRPPRSVTGRGGWTATH